jgi:hypothetical protein
MPQQYFSDREQAPRPRTSEEIPLPVWGGIVAAINSRVKDGSFGYRFPDTCPDGEVVCGCSETDFSLALRADIPDVSWPLNSQSIPPKLAILDLIEFCFQSAGKPSQVSYHSYYKHYHLGFNREEGKEIFREDINRIFARNGIAFELNGEGTIERLAPAGIRESLNSAQFRTGDNDLDALLEAARAKYLDADLNDRKDSLEKLWDAWERLKTLEDKDKKTGATILLNKAATEPTFRELLENEAAELTAIGNNFRIRHSETTKAPIETSEQVDYLFHRMFAMMHLLLRKTGRGG